MDQNFKDVNTKTNNRYSLDLSSFKAGSFLLNIRGESLIKTIRLQKQ